MENSAIKTMNQKQLAALVWNLKTGYNDTNFEKPMCLPENDGTPKSSHESWLPPIKWTFYILLWLYHTVYPTCGQPQNHIKMVIHSILSVVIPSIRYPLVIFVKHSYEIEQFAIENCHRKLVDLPSYKMMIFHSFLYVYQRVNPIKSHLQMRRISKLP